jgi:hypothetical protein
VADDRSSGTRRPGWREVLLVAVVAVAAVLAIQVLTTLIPAARTIVETTPILVVILLIVTGVMLWRISARQPPEP